MSRCALKAIVPSGFVPLSRPSFGEAECDAVRKCLLSGWVTTGPNVARFQDVLSKYFKGRKVLALSSNTAGLYLSLKALGIGAGDEVITTPLTFAATANVIEVVGARPVFCDVDPKTRNIDLSKAAEKVTSKTKALIPVHFAGIPVSLKGLADFKRAHNVRIIEDAAHAIGAVDGKDRVGAVGDIQVFSFHANKNLATAEGGAVVTNDSDVFDQIQKLHFHGLDRSAWDRFQKKGRAGYDIVAPALKFNMTDIQAALGLCQFERFETLQEKRQYLADRYLKGLSMCPYLEMPPEHNGNAWHLFAPLLRLDKLKCKRSTLIEVLKDRDVGTSVHYKPVHLFSYYKDQYGYSSGQFPHAEDIGSRTLSLPFFPDLSENDQDYVMEVLQSTLAEFER